ncbi:MAG: macro domain-containing protein [Spirochaetes bacterium]|nr:macro domain-containing protein [Spirochaetota bacterium]
MKKVKLELIKGDITERSTDTIINTANNLLILGSGLGGAIKSKGGHKITGECSRLGPINVGEAVMTSAGELKSKYIIHAALMEFDGPILEENISRSLISSLKLANRHILTSISIPDMSMGIVRFPPERCAEILFNTLKNFIKEENKSLELIEVVVWDIETLHIYKEIYKEIFKQEKP